MAKYLQLAIFVLMCVYVHTYENDEECESINRKNVGKGAVLDDIGDILRNERKLIQGEGLENLVSELSTENALQHIEAAGTESLKKLKEQTDNEAEEDMRRESVRSSLTGGKDGNIYFFEMCPYIRIWLKPGCAYFRYKEAGSKPKYKYCFNYWYFDYVCCQTKQCMTETCPFPRFDRNSECTEDKRPVNFPFVCYTYWEKPNGEYEGIWGDVEFRRISLAWNCCCQKQSSYRIDETCTDDDRPDEAQTGGDGGGGDGGGGGGNGGGGNGGGGNGGGGGKDASQGKRRRRGMLGDGGIHP